MAITLSAKQVAEELGTSAKRLRRFLRDEVRENGGTVGEQTPGKGGRYSFEQKEVRSIQKRFSAWSAVQAAKAAERAAAKAAEVSDAEDAEEE
jgi:hypothetical protein